MWSTHIQKFLYFLSTFWRNDKISLSYLSTKRQKLSFLHILAFIWWRISKLLFLQKSFFIWRELETIVLLLSLDTNYRFSTFTGFSHPIYIFTKTERTWLHQWGCKRVYDGYKQQIIYLRCSSYTPYDAFILY